MLETLIELDTRLFLLFNGYNDPTWDAIMFFISEKEVWYPLYLILIAGIFWRLKKAGFVFLVAGALAVGASDFTTSGIMKPSFERFRPSHEEAIKDKVHIVNNYRGGRYGFASSHASNSFAVATFFFFFYQNRFRWSYLLFIWAAIVTYSRLYLGVHYPGDLLVGGLIGALYGFVFFVGAVKVGNRIYPKKTRQITGKDSVNASHTSQ